MCALSVSAESHRESPPWRLPEALSRGELQLAEQLDLPEELVAVLRRRGHSDPAVIEILEPAPAPPLEQHFPDLPQAVERLHREGVGLLVTVGNGISARPALEQAQALGVEVIVTDHHATMT